MDFGFRNLTNIREFTAETKPIYDSTKYALTADGKYVSSNSVRLRSNEIVSLDGLKETFESLIVALRKINIQLKSIEKK